MGRYFVTVTFDLHKAKTTDYDKVRNELGKIDLAKVVAGRKRLEQRLPANTFVATFAKDKFTSSSKLVHLLSKEMSRIFDELSVKGHIFVVAGRRWAWYRGPVPRRR